MVEPVVLVDHKIRLCMAKISATFHHSRHPLFRLIKRYILAVGAVADERTGWANEEDNLIIGSVWPTVNVNGRPPRVNGTCSLDFLKFDVIRYFIS